MEALQGTQSGQKWGIQRVSWSHDAMIDIILANPTLTQGQLAEKLGYSVGWTSRVIGSDAFQARLAQRKTEIINPEIIASFEERIQGLASQSLEVISRKLDATSSPELAVKAFELSTKALGLGARAANVSNIQNNFVVALPAKVENEADWAAEGRKAMAELHQGGANQVMDVEVRQS